MPLPDTYYTATARRAPIRPRLQGEEKADICVIGAGYSGLSAALHLAEKGYRVIVLEAEQVGFGASGRNGGQIVNGYSRDDGVIRARYGDETADALLAMNLEGSDIVHRRIATYKIDCDLKNGLFFAAFTDAQMRALERRQNIWERAGNKSLSLYDTGTARGIVNSELYTGGLLDGRGGHLHPLNLARGEAAAIESHGSRIFEHSRVTHIDGNTVHTAEGRVTAPYIILCGNAYLKELPALMRTIMPVSSQIVATAPLNSGLAQELMPAGAAIEDCNFLLDYYRLSADNRLLFGGGVIYSGAAPRDIARLLGPRIARVFPALAGVKIDHAWSGTFALTLTRMPHVGRLNDTTYFIQGDNGHGITTCHLLGKLVAESVGGQAERFDVFANMRPYPFPGGRLFRVPLTALGAWYYGLREKLGL